MRNMTAEFDSSGFSAVDKFFGNRESEKTIGEKEPTTGSRTLSGVRCRQREGVGTSKKIEPASKQLSSDFLNKNVLGVGRKRSRNNSHEDASEGYEGDGVDDHGVHDANEADGGRTSILEMKTTASNKPHTTQENMKSAKKKLGRKERKRQNLAVNMEVFEANNNQERQRTIDNKITESRIERKTGDITTHTESTERTSKRKRRKVRSRQKNIRKDKRSVDEKPAYLVPGNQNYRGRPMTQATREKLNLPPPNKNFKKPGKDDNSSLFVIDRTPETPGNDVGVKLAIDEFMTIDGSAPIKDSPKESKRKDSSKRKKHRFKNLG